MEFIPFAILRKNNTLNGRCCILFRAVLIAMQLTIIALTKGDTLIFQDVVFFLVIFLI